MIRHSKFLTLVLLSLILFAGNNAHATHITKWGKDWNKAGGHYGTITFPYPYGAWIGEWVGTFSFGGTLEYDLTTTDPGAKILPGTIKIGVRGKNSQQFSTSAHANIGIYNWRLNVTDPLGKAEIYETVNIFSVANADYFRQNSDGTWTLRFNVYFAPVMMYPVDDHYYIDYVFLEYTVAGYIWGSVWNAATGVSLNGATVDLYSSQDIRVQTYASTYAGGAFEFDNLPPGNYYVRVRMSGFRDERVPGSGTFVLSEGELKYLGKIYLSPILPPSVTTSPASLVTSRSANLIGTVDPNGQSTKAWFEWGTSPDLSSFNRTEELDVGNSSSDIPITIVVFNLLPGTNYYYRIAASNIAGTKQGLIEPFDTPPEPPSVTTLPATSIASQSVTLNGRVNPNGVQTSAWFEWSTSPNLSTYDATPSGLMPPAMQNKTFHTISVV